MRDRFRPLAAILIAALVTLLWIPAASALADGVAQPSPAHVYDGHHDASQPTAMDERGPPMKHDRIDPEYALDCWSKGASTRPGAGTTPAVLAYDDTALRVKVAIVAPVTKGPGDEAKRNSLAPGRAGVAAKSGTELRRVGDALESIDDVFANPQLLAGRHPALVENILKGTPGWRVEKLGDGSQAGRGWVFRQYTERGHPTGPQLRWHPGGGHHGPDPYWRVVGPNGDLGGIIR